jgi:hypothetical protein
MIKKEAIRAIPSPLSGRNLVIFITVEECGSHWFLGQLNIYVCCPSFSDAACIVGYRKIEGKERKRYGYSTPKNEHTVAMSRMSTLLSRLRSA